MSGFDRFDRNIQYDQPFDLAPGVRVTLVNAAQSVSGNLKPKWNEDELLRGAADQKPVRDQLGTNGRLGAYVFIPDGPVHKVVRRKRECQRKLPNTTRKHKNSILTRLDIMVKQRSTTRLVNTRRRLTMPI